MTLRALAAAAPRGRASRMPEAVVGVVAGVAFGLLVVRALGSTSIQGRLLLVVAIAPFVALIAGNVRRLLLAVVVLDVALRWDRNFAYDDDAAALGALGGFSVSATTIAVAGLYTLWVAQLLARPEDAPRPMLRPALAVGAFTALTALSLVVARDRMLAGFEVQLLVELFLLFVYVVSVVRTRDEIRFAVTLLAVTLLLESVIIVASQYFGALPIPGASTRLDPSALATGDVARSGGTIGSPNAAGSFLSLLLAPALSVLATPLSRAVKRLAVIAFAFGLVALVFTLSRGAWLAFLVSMVVLALGVSSRGPVLRRRALASAVAVAVLALPFSSLILSRVGAADASAKARWPLNALAWRMVEDHPLLGVGANNFVVNIPDYAGPEFASDWLYAVHSKYFQVWSEAGTAALLAFLWFMVVTLRRGQRVWRANDPLLSPLALGLTAGVAGQLANMSIETYHGRPQVQLLWLAAALVAAMAVILARDGRLGEPA